MKNLLIILLTLLSFIAKGQFNYSTYLKDFDFKKTLKKHSKFATSIGTENSMTLNSV